LKEHGATAVGVGHKLESKLIKRIHTHTLMFKRLHLARSDVRAATRPVHKAFDELAGSLERLAETGGEHFNPIKGLAELFKTAAAWVDVIDLKFDSINTKAKRHAELWADAKASAEQLAHFADEEKDVNEDITSNMER